jgi:hypothetical protein
MSTLRWDDRTTHRVQTDNSIEAILRKSGLSSWLETCGPTSATIAADVTGHDVTVHLPGGGTIQGEDALTVWMNDPANVSILKAARPDLDPVAYMDNEIIQYYPAALQAVFGAHGSVDLSASWDKVVSAVRSGSAVMIHLTKPRHYLCVVAYDEAPGALVYRDPWPARTGTDGFNLRMLKPEFSANVQSSVVIVN